MLELHHTVGHREERIVASAPYVLARMKLGSSLANEDVARSNDLTTESLHTEVLRFGVASIAAGTYTFFMCRIYTLSLAQLQACNLDLSKILPVPSLSAVLLALLEFEDDNLVSPAVTHDLSSDLSTFNRWLAGLELVSVGREKNLVERNLGPRFSLELRHSQQVSLFSFDLFSDSLKNRV